jgi:hypothetical protein
MPDQPLQNPDIPESEPNSRRVLAAGAVSVSWLVLIACVHVMYVGFVLYGSKPRTAAVLATLTENGRQWYLPERELPIYVLGCVLAMVFSLYAAYRWQGYARRRDLADPGFTLRGCLLSLVLAALCSGFNLSWLIGIRIVAKLIGLPRMVTAVILIVPAIVEVVLFYASQKQKAGGSLQTAIVQLQSELKAAADRIILPASSSPANKPVTPKKQKGLYCTVDICIVLFICCVIYVPRTDLLAGGDFQFQHFHHWDFFAMGPAMGLLKGRHLATQVYCQYGFGWPLLLARLDPIFRLSYGHAYKIAVIYGCVYYCGLYWLLRRLLSNPAWAIAGLMLALRLQVFHGGRMEIPLWYIPSASILRTPCDIWVFLVLLSHWRSNRPLLLLLAGALVGLALLFVIDTGVYLALTFVGYNVLWLASSKNRGNHIRQSAAAVIVGAIVLVTGMFAASGSEVLSPGYIRQWLEVLWLYPSGISMLPMIQEPAGVIFSYWFILLFLACITAGIIRSCYERLKSEEAIVTCIAALGLLYLIYYIGNSHTYSIFQLSTPFCIVAASSAATAAAKLFGNRGRFRVSNAQLASGAAAVICTLMLFLNPQFRGYPSFIRSIFRPAPSEIVCFMPDLQDVCVPASQHPDTGPFLLAVSEMHRITNNGKTVAVIANDDTSLYVASRATLWNRYTPLLPPLMTQSMLAEVNGELSTKPVDFVLLKKMDPSDDGYWAGLHPPKTTDSWMMLSNTTRRLYHFDHECGAYEVWRR